MAIRGLTIYLLKEVADDPTAFLNFEAVTELDALVVTDVSWPLAIRQGSEKPPDWATFFQEFADPEIFGKTRSIGALLLVPAAGRWFALTFGTGRCMLLPGMWEERFGLRVVLNSIEEDKLRSIDKKTFEAVSLHAREQASEDSGTSAFGLDVERDLLRAVTGTPSNTRWGKRLSGMDSLKAHIEVDLLSLEDVLTLYYEKSLETSYREKFPWVDHISEVTDKALIQELDQLAVERLRGDDHKGFWLACPEIVDWSEVRGFRFGQSPRYLEYFDLHLRHFLPSVAPQILDLELLGRRRVFCVGDDDRVMKDWSVYECLNGEVDHEGSAFLLSCGRWYRVSQGFVADVNRYIDQIPRFHKELPACGDENEASYNSRVAATDPSFALMDRKQIRYGGGPSKFEFCDLFTLDRELIHVKKYGGSSLLSHLFSQGLSSADLFLGEAGFREKVYEELPGSHRLFDPQERPRPETYQVVFAIISQSQGPLWIPFFSRLSLRHACKRLQTLGYRVALAKIDVREEVAKTGRHRGAVRKTF